MRMKNRWWIKRRSHKAFASRNTASLPEQKWKRTGERICRKHLRKSNVSNITIWFWHNGNKKGTRRKRERGWKKAAAFGAVVYALCILLGEYKNNSREKVRIYRTFLFRSRISNMSSQCCGESFFSFWSRRKRNCTSQCALLFLIINVLSIVHWKLNRSHNCQIDIRMFFLFFHFTSMMNRLLLKLC